jgi:hypothetical protein
MVDGVTPVRTFWHSSYARIDGLGRVHDHVVNDHHAFSTRPVLPDHTARGSTVGRELRGGVVTFFTMAYIIVLNPIILSQAVDETGSYIGVVPTTPKPSSWWPRRPRSV